METSEYELYKGKSFASLCKDIVSNSEEKKQQLDVLITDLREMIKTVNDAVTIVPLLKDAGIRNDEQLIKLAAIVQRLMADRAGAESDSNSGILTDDEKKQLMSVIEEAAKPVQKIKQPTDERS
jgi:translation initiation factor 2B subunit (eIF-2B alpha/beta/delta family)